jgi:hypothetical protein
VFSFKRKRRAREMNLQKKNMLMAIGAVISACALMLTLGPNLSLAKEKEKEFSKDPFQLVFAENQDNGVEASTNYTVPDNKRLVIQFASAFVNAVDVDFPIIFIETFVDSTVARYYLTMNKAGSLLYPDLMTYYVGSQQMRVYADPGTTLTITIEPYAVSGCNNGTCGHFNFSIALSGYFEKY